MTNLLDSISRVASDYDVIVLDQYGVLHNGSSPYADAVNCLLELANQGTRLAVLSNSGKRSAPNAARIATMGFPASLFEIVMTSGEALWRDISNGTITERHFFSIESSAGDAVKWADGLDIQFEDSVNTAQAVLLMGLSDGHSTRQWHAVLNQALAKKLPIYCSNPDISSPRADGKLVSSPGLLARQYAEQGGTVVFYGKPHRVIFDSLKQWLKADRLLMVGDSLAHDIAGGHAAGWDTLLIQGGLYASEFSHGNHDATLHRIATSKGYKLPTYSIESLK